MTTPQPDVESETARCTYRERDPETGQPGRICGRLLTDPASVALHVGRTHFRRMVGATTTARRKTPTVHEGQLALDLDPTTAELERET